MNWRGFGFDVDAVKGWDEVDALVCSGDIETASSVNGTAYDALRATTTRFLT